MFKKAMLTISMVAMLSGTAHANSAEMLYEALDSDDKMMNIAGEGFVTGVYSLGIELGIICVPGNVTHDDLMKFIYWNLKENEEAWHLNAAQYVGGMLAGYFPCADAEVEEEEETPPWSPKYKDQKESI